MSDHGNIQRLGVTARYADATLYNGIVHAVEVPSNEDGPIATQMESLLASLERTLETAGSGKDLLLMATIYLVDMGDYDGMNVAWEKWLPAGSAPARACIRVAGLASAGWRVEVAVVASLRG